MKLNKHFPWPRLALGLLSLALSACAHTPSGDHQVTIMPQWHLSPQANVKVTKLALPQTENQIGVYNELVNRICENEISNVIVEGCEGEIKTGFNERFNGWTLSELVSAKPGDRDAALTMMGLKIKARFGSEIRVLCGDDLKLIKKHQLILSDLRGLFGFKERIAGFTEKSEHAKPAEQKQLLSSRAEYIDHVRKLLKIVPQANNEIVLERLDTELTEKIKAFEDTIEERNRRFVATVKAAKGPSAIVIGALHVENLKALLEADGEHVTVYHSPGLKGDESDLISDIKKIIKTPALKH